MLGFCDNTRVIISYARLMIMIMTFDVGYANYLAGARSRVVRINEEGVGPSQAYKVSDIHPFYPT